MAPAHSSLSLYPSHLRLAWARSSPGKSRWQALQHLCMAPSYHNPSPRAASPVVPAHRYGLGQIYFREEKYDMALQHFRMAGAVNGASSVLRCYQGMALAKMRRYPEALALLQEATASDPRNPLARYERAAVLMALERHDEALAELTALQVWGSRWGGGSREAFADLLALWARCMVRSLAVSWGALCQLAELVQKAKGWGRWPCCPLTVQSHTDSLHSNPSHARRPPHAGLCRRWRRARRPSAGR